MRNTLAAIGSPRSRSRIVMNMSGPKMSARLPTRCHEGGSMTRPVVPLRREAVVLALPVFASSGSTSTSCPSSST